MTWPLLGLPRHVGQAADPAEPLVNKACFLLSARPDAGKARPAILLSVATGASPWSAGPRMIGSPVGAIETHGESLNRPYGAQHLRKAPVTQG